MSKSDNHEDKDFVMSEEEQIEESMDSYEYERDDSPNAIVRKPSMLPAIITAMGFLVLIIFGIAILSRTQDLAEYDQLKALESRLEQLEHRLPGGDIATPRSPDAPDPEKRFEQLDARLERLEANINSKMDHIIKTLERRKEPPAQPPAPAAKAPQPEKKEEKAAQPKTHKVQAGETLYRISQRHGITVDQLRKINNLGPNAKIYPGQELRLTP